MRSIAKGLSNFENLQRLQSLEVCAQVNEIATKNECQLIISQKDYHDVIIPPNSVIYCDPPYTNTRGYDLKKRDSDPAILPQLLDYLRTHHSTIPAFVSEYEINDPRMTCILEIPKRVNINATYTFIRIEKLYATPAAMTTLNPPKNPPDQLEIPFPTSPK